MNSKNVLIVSLAVVAVVGGVIYLLTARDAYGRRVFKFGGDVTNSFGDAIAKVSR